MPFDSQGFLQCRDCKKCAFFKARASSRTQSGCKRRRLKLIPLVITHTQPFGRRLAFCSMSKDEGRTITLNVPTMFTDLMADSGTLLQKMVHQYLDEREERAGHDSGLAREIMRLHELVTGKKIWAGRSSATGWPRRPR
jgi:hypothetical protein